MRMLFENILCSIIHQFGDLFWIGGITSLERKRPGSKENIHPPKLCSRTVERVELRMQLQCSPLVWSTDARSFRFQGQFMASLNHKIVMLGCIVRLLWPNAWTFQAGGTVVSKVLCFSRIKNTNAPGIVQCYACTALRIRLFPFL